MPLKKGVFNMSLALTFTRIFFGILGVFFMTLYTISYPTGSLLMKFFMGISLGVSFTVILAAFDAFFRRFHLRIFNTAVIGLFLGYLMGKELVITFEALVQISSLAIHLHPSIAEIIKISMFLLGSYIGTILTIKFSDEFHLSIPFIRFTHSVHKKKDVLLDPSTLSDMRIVEFCSTGILNNQLVLPRFILKELHQMHEESEEVAKGKIRKSLEVVKKLESLPSLGLRINDTDFSEIKDAPSKLIKLARLLDANILTGDAHQLQFPSTEDILFINLHSLSNALKPLTPPGETIQIKVQRHGKEPKQGVGYLEDGTMVVINNGGDYIGEIIETQVISVKQTSAGRIIFTNAMVEEDHFNSHSNYEHPAYHE